MANTNKIFRYKTLAPISFVDETLFETRKKVSDASERSIIISRSELERIRRAAHVRTVEEKDVELDFQCREREKAKKAVAERLAKLQQADILRKKKQGLSQLEAEARDKSLYLVERANEIRMEDDQEVKNLNTLALGAKCCAERDAQVQEWRQMAAVEEQEDRQRDSVMEQDRRMAVRAQEEVEEMRKQERMRGKMRIQEQIEERMEERRLQDEIKQQERQKLLENLEKMKMEDLQTQGRKKEEQRRLHQEVLEFSEESQRVKARMKEEERAADVRIVENTCRKMEEQRIRRNQEALENEWKRNEREQTKKKADNREWWAFARQEQMSDKEQQLAIIASRERADYERVLRAQNDDVVREKEKEEKRRQRAAHYLFGVRQQMREREARAIEQRQAELQEHERILEEALNRRMRLNEIKARKLMELKAAGIPEKYCSKVENKVSISRPTSQPQWPKQKR
ncbi:hypothetical protein AAFF_G00397330 [Aldrovandia affinis]|uniref:Cilia- and flagella-associated protein 45 n=1 Tax=Aldrovandia affinis TaxID=143900 RepID=A0AAD7WKT9_9TELE|nr:hypothetical protein AAFF_G00397330 [Aldrovandia affinis]